MAEETYVKLIRGHQIRELMDKAGNVRNMSVIAHGELAVLPFSARQY
jgi:hypothetical protein